MSGAGESFSRRVKAELAHLKTPRECCRRSEMVAFVRSAGTLHLLGDNESALEVDAPDAGVARVVYNMLSTLGGNPEVRLYAPGRAHPSERFVVRLVSTDPTLLSRAGALDAEGLPARGIPKTVASRRCCSAAYLRASFISHGTVTPPRTPAHFEIRANDEETANGLVRLGERVGARLKSRFHRDAHSAYCKDVTSVGALLAAMGAHQACLDWETGGVWSTVRGQANRLANADAANVRRTVGASGKQRDAIRALDAQGMLDKIPGALRDAARVRLEHPHASLTELAEFLGISRSAMADRLRRLVAMTEQLD